MIHALLKIYSEKEHVKQLQKGEMYFRKVRCFQEQAEEMGEQRGDKNEGYIVSPLFNCENINTNQKGMAKLAPSISLLESYIFCLYTVKCDNVEQLPSPLCIDSSLFEFGKYILFIKDPNEFIRRVQKILRKQNVEYRTGVVQYYDENSSNIHLKPELFGFYKRMRYKKQNEYRILAKINSPHDTQVIHIGDISDISVATTFGELK